MLFTLECLDRKNENARQLSSKARLIHFGIVDKVLTGKKARPSENKVKPILLQCYVLVGCRLAGQGKVEFVMLVLLVSL